MPSSSRARSGAAPEGAVGYVLEGDIAQPQKNWDAAAVAYRAGPQRSTKHRVATKLHAVLLASGKTAESDAFAAAWLKEHPKDAAFLSHLGELALARKDYTAAEKHLPVGAGDATRQRDRAQQPRLGGGHVKRTARWTMRRRQIKLAPNQSAFMDTLATLLADRKEFARPSNCSTGRWHFSPPTPACD